MIKKLFILFKIARKLALSDALKIISKFHQPPLIIKIFLNLFSISFSKNNYQSNKIKENNHSAENTTDNSLTNSEKEKNAESQTEIID